MLKPARRSLRVWGKSGENARRRRGLLFGAVRLAGGRPHGHGRGRHLSDGSTVAAFSVHSTNGGIEESRFRWRRAPWCDPSPAAFLSLGRGGRGYARTGQRGTWQVGLSRVRSNRGLRRPLAVGGHVATRWTRSSIRHDRRLYRAGRGRSGHGGRLLRGPRPPRPHLVDGARQSTGRADFAGFAG